MLCRILLQKLILKAFGVCGAGAQNPLVNAPRANQRVSAEMHPFPNNNFAFFCAAINCASTKSQHIDESCAHGAIAAQRECFPTYI